MTVDLPDSKVIAGFDVQQMILEGDITAVFAVRDDDGGLWAMKVPTVEALRQPMLRKRFEREMDILGRLQGAAFPTLRAGGVYATRDRSNIPYLVTSLPRGETLDHLMAVQKETGETPDPEVAVHLLRTMAEALQQMHAAGIVHRNLKPAKIAMSREGEVQILDFVLGLGQASAALTGDREFVGTMRYVAPEQALDPHHVDGRADLYSLGIILWEFLTHRHPFDLTGPRGMNEVVKHFSDDPPAPSVANPAVPPMLDEIVARLTRRHLNERFQAAAEVMDALDEAFPLEV
ncbi:MAG: serine/threonine protein kinase [Candidatus Xenobia bacterium]